jgi:hypothetical protein
MTLPKLLEAGISHQVLGDTAAQYDDWSVGAVHQVFGGFDGHEITADMLTRMTCSPSDIACELSLIRAGLDSTAALSIWQLVVSIIAAAATIAFTGIATYIAWRVSKTADRERRVPFADALLTLGNSVLAARLAGKPEAFTRQLLVSGSENLALPQRQSNERTAVKLTRWVSAYSRMSIISDVDQFMAATSKLNDTILDWLDAPGRTMRRVRRSPGVVVESAIDTTDRGDFRSR